jgi:hypothetical protein
MVVGVLDPDDVDVRGPGLVDEDADVGHDVVPVVRVADDAVLDVDDEQRGLRSVGAVFGRSASVVMVSAAAVRAARSC